MSEKQGKFIFYSKSPFLQLAITLLIIVTLGLALLTVLTVVGIFVSGLRIGDLSGDFLNTVGEKNIFLLRYLMVCQEIALFIVPAIIVRRMLLSQPGASVSDTAMPPVRDMIFVLVLAFSLFPLTSFTGELNAGMKLPGWLSGVEQWMKASEDQASGVLDQLVPSENAGVLILNIFIIGILPAISEELIFRGVFQRIFYGFFRSVHPAIWLTAIIFSAIHLQFYGFLPRLILGLVFGYLYYWGRTLWLPVIAHFVNNAVPVAWVFFEGTSKISSQADATLWKQLIALPLPLIITVWIMIYFRNKKLNSPAR